MSVGKTTLVNALKELEQFKGYEIATERSTVVKTKAEELTKVVTEKKVAAENKARQEAEAKAAAEQAERERQEAEAAAAAVYNPVDLTDVMGLPSILQGYTPIAGNIYPENRRGELVEILKAKAASGQDDPHTLTQRLVRTEGLEMAAYMDQYTYAYLDDISIRAYAHYVGSDFLDNEWRAKYLHYAGYGPYFFGVNP